MVRLRAAWPSSKCRLWIAASPPAVPPAAPLAAPPLACEALLLWPALLHHAPSPPRQCSDRTACVPYNTRFVVGQTFGRAGRGGRLGPGRLKRLPSLVGELFELAALLRNRRVHGHDVAARHPFVPPGNGAAVEPSQSADVGGARRGHGGCRHRRGREEGKWTVCVPALCVWAACSSVRRWPTDAYLVFQPW